MKFKAAILTKLNSPIEIEEIENTKLEIGQVFVKIIKMKNHRKNNKMLMI